MARVLVLSGGPDHAHDYETLGTTLTSIVRDDGHEIVGLFDDPDAAAERLRDGDVDVFVVNALRWRMQGEAYDPWRDRWAYTTPDSTRDAITGFVAAGGGLVGNHTASICFDDWPEWGDVLGGAWAWGRSWHPPIGPVTVEMTVGVTAHDERADAGAHPVVSGLPARFVLADEVYGDLDLRPGIEPLAHARRSPDDAPQPLVWTHRYGAGRVVYDGLGHDERSLNDPVHRRLICNAVRWVSGDR